MCREELIDFDKYAISEDGTIYSKHFRKKIDGWCDKDGYLVSCLTLKNGKRQPYRINRVIAYLFCDKPEHLKEIPYEELQVGHSDTNRKNNNSDNLYWCTSKENNNNPITKEKQIGKKPWNKGIKKCFSEEAIKKMSITRSVPIKQLAKDGTLIKIWKSSKEAANILGIPSSNITACLNKHRHRLSAGGYKWERVEKKEYENNQLNSFNI